MKLVIGTRIFDVPDLAAASACYCKIRDESGEGASTFPRGFVADGATRQTFLISYNGKVWDKPWWNSQNPPKPVFNPYA